MIDTLTPEEQAYQQSRLKFAREWMQRKRQDQQEMIDSFHSNPEISVAFTELKQRNAKRGTAIVAL